MIGKLPAQMQHCMTQLCYTDLYSENLHYLTRRCVGPRSVEILGNFHCIVMYCLPKATRIKEESLKIVKLKLGLAGVEWVEEFSLSSTWGAAFLGTRTSPNMLQARHKQAITLHGI
jgi:hypothetical protein